jgi:hypothetical protein
MLALVKELTCPQDLVTQEEIQLEGIQFVINEKGERVAVQIDLRKHGDVWEDVYDSITARNRSREPRESLKSLKERLIKRRKLNG